MAEFSPRIHILLEQYLAWRRSMEPAQADTAVISVDEVASAVAAFYEKIRGVVDWREEHLLRKMAIYRILHRRLLLTEKSEEIAEPFLQELVRGGHFLNNTIPIEQITAVQSIITKYVFIIEQNLDAQTPKNLATKDKRPLQDWLLLLAASEIEEQLSPPIRERGLAAIMIEDMTEGLLLPGVPDEEKRLHVSFVTERVLLKSDEATLTLHLICMLEPAWQNPSPDMLNTLAQNIWLIRKHAERILTNPLRERLHSFLERHTIPYLILGDLIQQSSNDFKKAYQEPATLEEAVQKAYQERLRQLKKKLGRAAIYGTISIFVTKILLALAIELPVDHYLAGQSNPVTLAASVAIPPLLMIVLLFSVRPSSQENMKRVIMDVIRIAYAKEKPEPKQIREPRKRKSALATVVGFTYFLSFILTFGLIAWGLTKLQFSWPSTVIFLVFLSLVAFAGTRLRKNSRELLVTEEKHTFLDGLFDFFSMPLVYAGKWLSGQIARYNVVLLALNFLIEIPFQLFVEFLEQWRAFLKEKKEGIR